MKGGLLSPKSIKFKSRKKNPNQLLKTVKVAYVIMAMKVA